MKLGLTFCLTRATSSGDPLLGVGTTFTSVASWTEGTCVCTMGGGGGGRRLNGSVHTTPDTNAKQARDDVQGADNGRHDEEQLGELESTEHPHPATQ